MVKNLRNLRLQRGISQQRLADAVELTQQAINQYENHSIEPDIYMLMRLADYFEVSVDYLIGHTPSKEDAPEEAEPSREEWALLRDWRTLNASQKDSLRQVIRNYKAK